MIISDRISGKGGPLASPVIAFLILMTIAFATRFVAFGNPIADPDDQFYLLVGDAMRHGAWPYIDYWDRKPWGLFALFAGIAAVGHGSILAMQLIATLFAAATAYLVRRIALLFVGAEASLLAACAYLLMLPLFAGQVGQTAVFYNLFTAAAMLALFQVARAPARSVIGPALFAMFCFGLSMAIKPVAVVEGIFCGLAFLWLMIRREVPTARLVGTAFAMVVIALLPTLLPLTAYGLRGPDAFGMFVHANFLSIFQKGSLGGAAREAGMFYFLLYMAPLLVFAAIGVARVRKSAEPPLPALLIGWIVAAFGGYLLVPTFFDQYALPLILPLSVAAAATFTPPTGRLYAAALALFCLMGGQITAWSENRREQALYSLVSDRVEQARHDGCILVNEGPTWLHASTGGCTLTRYVFPGHLNLVTEVGAVGVDTVAETRRILAQRPAVIVTMDNRIGRHNPRTVALIRNAVDRDYQLVAMTDDTAPEPVATLRIWQRRDLGPAPTSPERLSVGD